MNCRSFKEIREDAEAILKEGINNKEQLFAALPVLVELAVKVTAMRQTLRTVGEIGGKLYHFAAGYGKPVRRDGDNLTQEFLNGLPEKWLKGKLELDVTGMARLGVTSEELAAAGPSTPFAGRI